MDDQSQPNEPNAESHYEMGLSQKTQGNFDAALTSFRRAVLADPKNFNAQMELGHAFRIKARIDKTFLRHEMEAFRAAARLNRNHEDAQNQYITACQKAGAMDDLVSEYGDLARKFPDNPILQRCHKNILALSMAMMPQQVHVAGAQASSALRKFVIIASIAVIITGLAFIAVPPMMLKSGKLTKEQVSGMVKLGCTLFAVGAIGFVLKSKLE